MNDEAPTYPGYDVLSKRQTPSWNPQTRAVVDKRLAIDPDAHRFFTDYEWASVKAIAGRIVPQPVDRPSPVPVAAMVDDKLEKNSGDGYRRADMPPMREAWRRALSALDVEARSAYGEVFHQLAAEAQDRLLSAMQNGALVDASWGGMSSKSFFHQRVVADMVKAYYAHPTAWSEIGFGGPASPRGYVRMEANRCDGWEAAQAKPGGRQKAFEENQRVGR